MKPSDLIQFLDDHKLRFLGLVMNDLSGEILFTDRKRFLKTEFVDFSRAVKTMGGTTLFGHPKVLTAVQGCIFSPLRVKIEG